MAVRGRRTGKRSRTAPPPSHETSYQISVSTPSGLASTVGEREPSRNETILVSVLSLHQDLWSAFPAGEVALRVVDRFNSDLATQSGVIIAELRDLVKGPEFQRKLPTTLRVRGDRSADEIEITVVFSPADAGKKVGDEAKQIDYKGETGATTEGPDSQVQEKDQRSPRPINQRNSEKSLIGGLRAILFESPNLPQEYGELINDLGRIRSAVTQQIGRQLESVMSDHWRSQPAETLEQKQEICKAANADLRRLGLAILCPKTNKPAILVADYREGDGSASRFRFQVEADSGGRTRTVASGTFPELKLIEAPVREEPFVSWTRRVKDAGPSSKSGRKPS